MWCAFRRRGRGVLERLFLFCARCLLGMLVRRAESVASKRMASMRALGIAVLIVALAAVNFPYAGSVGGAVNGASASQVRARRRMSATLLDFPRLLPRGCVQQIFF